MREKTTLEHIIEGTFVPPDPETVASWSPRKSIFRKIADWLDQVFGL